MNTTGRPISVTVIAWILIVLYAFSVTVFPLMALMPSFREAYERAGRSWSVGMAIIVATGVAGLVAGIAMLKRRNWGRMLYFFVAPAPHVITTVAQGFSPWRLPGLILYAVMVVFLTRPAASAFFRSSAPATPPSAE